MRGSVRRYCRITVLLFDMTLFVDKRYVTLGGCTVQRYVSLQEGGGCHVFQQNALHNT